MPPPSHGRMGTALLQAAVEFDRPVTPRAGCGSDTGNGTRKAHRASCNRCMSLACAPGLVVVRSEPCRVRGPSALRRARQSTLRAPSCMIATHSTVATCATQNLLIRMTMLVEQAVHVCSGRLFVLSWTVSAPPACLPLHECPFVKMSMGTLAAPYLCAWRQHTESPCFVHSVTNS